MVDWYEIKSMLWDILAMTVAVGLGVALGLTIFFAIAPGLPS